MRSKKNEEILFYLDVLSGLVSKSVISEETKNLVSYHMEFYIMNADYGRRRYNATNKLVIICTSLIPLINMVEVKHMKYVASILAIISSVAISISSLKSYKLTWLKYRQAAEEIKASIREIAREIYKNENSINCNTMLLESLNTTLENEVKNWNKYLKDKKERGK